MRRGLRLLPTLLASGLWAMTQVGPGEAQANLCHWLKLAWSHTSDACLQGIPTGALYAVVAIAFFGRCSGDGTKDLKRMSRAKYLSLDEAGKKIELAVNFARQ
jgi:hypothetical protein